MTSDFALAREHLELAWLKLSGEDETSAKARQAIDILIDAVTKAEYTKLPGEAQIVIFPRSPHHS